MFQIASYIAGSAGSSLADAVGQSRIGSGGIDVFVGQGGSVAVAEWRFQRAPPAHEGERAAEEGGARQGKGARKRARAQREDREREGTRAGAGTRTKKVVDLLCNNYPSGIFNDL